jgi:SanA protein
MVVKSGYSGNTNLRNLRAMVKRFKILLLIVLVTLSLTVLTFLWPWLIGRYYGQFIYGVDEAPPERVAIVFGARIYPDGRLSAMLQDRVETAVQLYQAGRVEKLLLSGDNRFVDYDEPGRMMDYAISRGVPAEDIQLDYAGRRTYDTCYRAGVIFRLESAMLVTQSFHLPRALFICRNLGIDAVGVRADLRSYHPRSIGWSTLREIPAVLVALVDVLRQRPAAVLGDPILIE